MRRMDYKIFLKELNAEISCAKQMGYEHILLMLTEFMVGKVVLIFLKKLHPQPPSSSNKPGKHKSEFIQPMLIFKNLRDILQSHIT